MKIIIQSIVFLAFCLICIKADAQKGDLITADFDHAGFDKFVSVIESQTAFHIYYDPTQTDSISITLKVSDAHLTSVLDRVFNQTKWSYTVDGFNIFITKSAPLALELPPGFLQGQEVVQQVVQESNEHRAEQATQLQKKQAISDIEENKTYEIGIKTNGTPKGKVNVAGYVRSAATGEGIPGVIILTDKGRINVNTDQFGYYSITLPAGRHTIEFSTLGMFNTHRKVILYSNGRLNVDMWEKVIQLREVVIDADKERNIRSTVMGMDKLNIAAIKQIPAVLGEVDVLRAVMNLPGVKTVGEASTGLNVRGGSTDQNLILFNDANIFNPSHLFGFFSAVNSDLVKDVELYKSSIPAEFGGRLSSVLNITSLDGNSKKLTGNAGLGLFTSKLSLNGPIVKDKTTFAAGVRTTYSNWLMNLLPDEYKDGRGSFYDGTIHISHKIDANNRLYVNGYISSDEFNLTGKTKYQYKNKNANIKWKKGFNNKFYGVFLAGWDHYQYQVRNREEALKSYLLSYAIDQYKFKADFNYFLSNNHTIKFGLSSKLYKNASGKLSPSLPTSLIILDTLETEQALESALYISDKYDVSADLTIEAGLRYNVYNYLGPKTLYQYVPGVPKNASSITGTKTYGSGKFIKTYTAPDFRVSMRYLLSDNLSMKASFNSLNQYIHQLSNTTTISPTDIWKLADPYIKPEQGSQVSLGLYRNFKSNTIETSLEVYYKWINHFLDYKSGAKLVMNHHLETDVFNTKGKAYGVELMIKKSTGKLNGWVTYNYSRALIRQDDPLAGELINNGDFYPTNFDQPQSANFIGNYKINHRFSISLNVSYSTGRPITLPIATYDYAGGERVLYSDRNAYRIPDYFRTDFSMNLEGNHKIHQLFHNSWSFGIYNVTGRKNAYSVYFVTENGKINGYKLSIFGTQIPFVTYNVRF